MSIAPRAHEIALMVILSVCVLLYACDPVSRRWSSSLVDAAACVCVCQLVYVCVCSNLWAQLRSILGLETILGAAVISPAFDVVAVTASE